MKRFFNSTNLHLQVHFVLFPSPVLLTPTNCLGITMSPRSASGWPEWEEKNLLSWLDAHQELSWKARSDAYYEQHRVARSAESLRGKKYHILRKCRRAGARVSDRSVDQKQSKAVRASVGRKASLAALPNKIPFTSDIDKWFETILAAEASQTDSNGSGRTESSRLGRATRVSIPCWLKETRSSSSMWDYVHRVCAARKLE
ncbi:unnamed protein product [Penicillium salamii]|uniref:Clr5 domain-containing protein n=1 Tax=Penicillium salamii TaxID=1612424 RepID=A0A9W4N950_9EURO|nr:unnamed protein product [Penicillium salamii]CAG8146777.1 unnamed protein product [Penicillium salamii]CAG8296933.1 unnamed protein product [Penicillium salamii]CAG8360284.1 unnamed protein product [Penicillium salamii]CAG8875783.1 unnamed protein product [Penicillium salamii]